MSLIALPLDLQRANVCGVLYFLIHFIVCAY